MFKNEGTPKIKDMMVPEDESTSYIFDARADAQGLDEKEILEYFEKIDRTRYTLRTLHGLKDLLPNVWGSFAKKYESSVYLRVHRDISINSAKHDGVFAMAEYQALDAERFAQLFKIRFPYYATFEKFKESMLQPEMTNWENIMGLAAFLRLRDPVTGERLVPLEEARKRLGWNMETKAAIEEKFVTLAGQGFVGLTAARTPQYYELDPEWCAEKILPLVAVPRVWKEGHSWVRKLRDDKSWNDYFAFALNLDQLSKLLQKHLPPEESTPRPTSRHL